MQSILWFGLSLVTSGLALLSALVHNALRSFSRAHLEEALEARGRLDDLGPLYQHHTDLLQMTRVLHIVSLVAMTVLASMWATERLGATAAGWLVGAALAGAVGVIVTGVIPLAWAHFAAESVLVAALPVCQVLRVLFGPVQRVLRLFDELVRRLAGAPRDTEPLTDIEEEIASVVGEGEREGAIEEDQKDMIENVIKFNRADASQIMTPRTDIVSIEAEADAEDARRLIAASGYSRIPVTLGNLDTIVGILYAKDLLDRFTPGRTEGPAVRDVMRSPVFVPETKRLDELLREFQAEKNHMAIVLDEYGGTSGLVTIEDVIEEIVGEIADEYEPEPPKLIRAVSDRAFEVEARAHIDELNDALGLDLPEHEDYETIGGFVLSRLGYIPKAGESLDCHDLTLTVLEADERRIARLRIDLAARTEAAGES